MRLLMLAPAAATAPRQEIAIQASNRAYSPSEAALSSGLNVLATWTSHLMDDTPGSASGFVLTSSCPLSYTLFKVSGTWEGGERQYHAPSASSSDQGTQPIEHG